MSIKISFAQGWDKENERIGGWVRRYAESGCFGVFWFWSSWDKELEIL